MSTLKKPVKQLDFEFGLCIDWETSGADFGKEDRLKGSHLRRNLALDKKCGNTQKHDGYSMSYSPQSTNSAGIVPTLTNTSGKEGSNMIRAWLPKNE